MTAKRSSNSANDLLAALGATIESRKGADPGDSYVASLFDAGRDKILKKVGEEATETILAAASGDREHVIRETADLWFHTLVMLAELDLCADDVLERRLAGDSTAAAVFQTTPKKPVSTEVFPPVIGI